MFEKVKKGIGRFLIKKRYLKKPRESKNFNGFFTNCKDIVLLMPHDNSGFHHAENFAKNLQSISKRVILVMPELGLNLLQNKQDFVIYDFKLTDINPYNLPEKNFTSKLKSITCDVIIDLNHSTSNFISSVLFEIDADFRVGFTKPNSDLYYNFQVKYDEINPDISLKNLLNSLQMF